MRLHKSIRFMEMIKSVLISFGRWWLSPIYILRVISFSKRSPKLLPLWLSFHTPCSALDGVKNFYGKKGHKDWRSKQETTPRHEHTKNCNVTLYEIYLSSSMCCKISELLWFNNLIPPNHMAAYRAIDHKCYFVFIE